jgi:hypothetical protein
VGTTKEEEEMKPFAEVLINTLLVALLTCVAVTGESPSETGNIFECDLMKLGDCIYPDEPVIGWGLAAGGLYLLWMLWNNRKANKGRRQEG